MKRLFKVFFFSLILLMSCLQLFAAGNASASSTAASTLNPADVKLDGVLTAEEANVLTNNRMSYDPENYDYTFGLIPPRDLDIHFTTHIYVETAMIHGFPALGGTWDIGIGVDTVTISLYARFLHFFRPMGSDTGNLYIGEEMSEVGLSFKVRAYELGRFNVNLGINTGWYQQWLMHYASNNTYNMVNNGVMLRPEASIGWNWLGRWNMELGFFYQTPLYPAYEGYQAWGVFVKIA